MTLPRKLIVLAAVAIAAGTAFAAVNEDAKKAYTDANNKMMQDMMMELSGDPDMDFVMMMLPHHQGAVDMAKIELQYGKDAELRKMAEDIVTSQEKEIEFMKAWNKKHGM
ncbi:hypothetical protein BH10PSE7_BH10PSE7_42260 [soil metagenome]